MTETTERLRYTFYCKRERQNPTQDSITSLQIFYYSVSQQKSPQDLEAGGKSSVLSLWHSKASVKHVRNLQSFLFNTHTQKKLQIWHSKITRTREVKRKTEQYCS